MAALLKVLFFGVLKLLLIAFGLLYVGMVLMAYRTDGPRFPLRIDFTDPARSAERFLVWIGVRALDATLRAARATVDALSEASAEVGEWFVHRSGVEVQSKYRSRFL